MTEKRQYNSQASNNQVVFSSVLWDVLLPEHPVNAYHLLIVTKRDDAREFTSLKNEELAGLRWVVSALLDSISTYDAVAVLGYNLFSNNGTYEVGQHLDRFHEHVFIRTDTENESPFTIMNSGRRWFAIDSPEWTERRDAFREMFAILDI